MVEVAVVITVGTVLILMALTVISRWIIPKVLAEEQPHEEPETEPPSEHRPSA